MTRRGLATWLAPPVLAAVLGFATAPRAGSIPGPDGPDRSASESVQHAADRSADGTRASVRSAVVRIAPPTITLRDHLGPTDEPIVIAKGEVRDDAWATRVEETFRGEYEHYVTAMMPYASDVKFECKAQTCRVSFLAPTDHYFEGNEIIQGFAISDVFEPKIIGVDAGTVEISVTSFFVADQRDPDLILSKFHTTMHERFPQGYESVRAWIDSHPDGGVEP